MGHKIARDMSHVIVAKEEARSKKQGWRGGDVRVVGTATSAVANTGTKQRKRGKGRSSDGSVGAYL